MRTSLERDSRVWTMSGSVRRMVLFVVAIVVGESTAVYDLVAGR